METGLRILFYTTVALFIIFDVAWNIFVWRKYHPDYRKIRIYISKEGISDLAKKLTQSKIECSKEYAVEQVDEQGYRYYISFQTKRGKAQYLVKMIQEHNDTVILVQYDRQSTGKAIKFAELDTYMQKQLGVKLK